MTSEHFAGPARTTQPRFLSTKEAARFLTLSHRTLEDWRLRGDGPPFVKLGGSVKYAREDLETFVSDRRRSNTGQHQRPVAAG